MQPLKEMSFVDLVNECAGRGLLQIGAGRSWREVILDIVHMVVSWKEELKKVDRQPSDQIIRGKVVNATVDVSDPNIYTFAKNAMEPNVEYVFRGEELIDVKLIKA